MKLLAHGDGWIAVDKPAGAVVVRDRAGKEESLFDRAKAELERELWLVHRLDRETSGVLLFATSESAQRELSQDFEHARVKKTYLALCAGVPIANEGRVTHPIAEGRKGRMVIRTGGKASATNWRVLKRFPANVALPPAFKPVEPIARESGYSWIEAKPETGRTHQIRVHLASLGLPITGDPLYDFSGAPALAGRVALHAMALEIRGQRIESPLPQDLAEALDRLGR